MHLFFPTFAPPTLDTGDRIFVGVAALRTFVKISNSFFLFRNTKRTMSLSDSEEQGYIESSETVLAEEEEQLNKRPSIGDRMQNMKQRVKNRVAPGMQRLRGAMAPKGQRRRVVEYRHNPIHDTLFNIEAGINAVQALCFFAFSEYVWYFLMADAPLFRLEDRIVFKGIG
jgi:hypothetical protein